MMLKNFFGSTHWSVALNAQFQMSSNRTVHLFSYFMCVIHSDHFRRNISHMDSRELP